MSNKHREYRGNKKSHLKNKKIFDKNLLYRLYFGVPHSHTKFSTGEGTVEEACEISIKNKIDFLFITDHSKELASKTSYKNKEKLKDTEMTKWNITKYEVKEEDKRQKKLLILAAYELNSEYLGHVNMYNCKNLTFGRYKRKEDILKWCRENPEIIIGLNHPSGNILNISYDSELDKYINFFEIGNGSYPYKYKRREQLYYKFLDKGWKVGVLNGQDNHKKNWGEESNLTVVMAKKLKEKEFIEALKSRRTYSTESKSLKMIFSINNYFMGSKIDTALNKTLNFKVLVKDKINLLEKVQVISNRGEIVREFKAYDYLFEEEFSIEKEDKNTWYLIKIIQKDDRISISSPIFF